MRRRKIEWHEFNVTPSTCSIYAAQPSTIRPLIACIHAADVNLLRFTHALTSVAVLIKEYLERTLHPPITWDQMTELVNLKHACRFANPPSPKTPLYEASYYYNSCVRPLLPLCIVHVVVLI